MNYRFAFAFALSLVAAGCGVSSFDPTERTDDVWGAASSSLTVSVAGGTVTVSGKTGPTPTTYTCTIKNAAGVVVYTSTQALPGATNFSFAANVGPGNYTLKVVGTDGTNFSTAVPVP